jgi:hypothetical protein
MSRPASASAVVGAIRNASAYGDVESGASVMSFPASKFSPTDVRRAR